MQSKMSAVSNFANLTLEKVSSSLRLMLVKNTMKIQAEISRPSALLLMGMGRSQQG